MSDTAFCPRLYRVTVRAADFRPFVGDVGFARPLGPEVRKTILANGVADVAASVKDEWEGRAIITNIELLN